MPRRCYRSAATSKTVRGNLNGGIRLLLEPWRYVWLIFRSVFCTSRRIAQVNIPVPMIEHYVRHGTVAGSFFPDPVDERDDREGTGDFVSRQQNLLCRRHHAVESQRAGKKATGYRAP
jgi:hypothetical protein